MNEKMEKIRNELKHGIETGSIVFQVPEDEYILKELLEITKREIAEKPNEIDEDLGYFVCNNCDCVITYLDEIGTHRYCLNCGQKFKWS